jgi:predicted ATPase
LATERRSGAPGLPTVSIVTLFAPRAVAAWPTFRLTGGAAQSAEAVRRAVDGLPLVVELAAPTVE